jgi:P-type E1-E2 ATPase
MAIAALLGYATGSLAVAAERALATAMVICPCGLAIARPLAQLRCVARAAKSGIRISNPKAADALVAARTVIFDKTGTLTSDRLAVSDILPEPGVSSQAVLAAASAAEASIRHPVAEAIIRASGEPGAASGIRLDRGALGHWEGQSVSVRASEMSVSDGRTWVDVLVDERLTGRIALSATIDTTAPHTIGRLRRAGIHVGCATGDNESAARMVAEAVGLQPSDVASACSPVDKADRVRRSMRPVVFIGDGVNDAPALAAADCGIVVAGAHRAAAVTADIVLVEGSIDRLLTAQAAARHMRAVTRVGLVLAAAYNAVTIPAAILGFLSPVAAAAAMTASSVLVLVNAARA